MHTSPFLTDAEVAEMCEPLTMGAAQCRYLARLGLLVKKKPSGRPLVSRRAYELLQSPAKQEPIQAHECGLKVQPTAYEDSGLARYHATLRASALLLDAEKAKAVAEWAAGDAERAAVRKERRRALVLFHSAKRRAEKLKRTPPWADIAAIRAIYEKARAITCATGVPHHVDHIIPLQGEIVSGLHVESNLQILTGSDNSKKKNSFTGDGLNCGFGAAAG